MVKHNKKVALVTGGQRGLGFQACLGLAKKGYTVIMTGVLTPQGRKAARQLQEQGLDVVFRRLDVTSDADVAKVKTFVLEKYGRLDVLVNNAGVLIDEGKSIMKVNHKTFARVFDINTLGALRLCQAFIPVMLKQKYGRVVNLASGRGQLGGDDPYAMIDDGPAYNMSKAAVNALTQMFARATEGTNVLVNSLCPGWCRTDMGGPDAPRSPEKGAETIIWLATLADSAPTGTFFRDKKPIDW